MLDSASCEAPSARDPRRLLRRTPMLSITTFGHGAMGRLAGDAGDSTRLTGTSRGICRGIYRGRIDDAWSGR